MARQESHDGSQTLDVPGTENTNPEGTAADDDLWVSDTEQGVRPSCALDLPRHEMLSDLPTVKRQHMTDGYREGLSVGKARVMQKGFDQGYPLGVAIALRAGKVLGCFEGVLAGKDISDEVKISVKKDYEKAKSELAITALMKDMDDQTIMQTQTLPARFEQVLARWESVTFGESTVIEGRSEIPRGS